MKAERSHKLEICLIAATAIGAGLLVVLPHLLVAFVGRPGDVWTLFNSANYRAGDMYYYASMVQQVIWGNIPPHPPFSDSGVASPETFRWSSYLIASLPAFFGAQTRVVHLFTLAFTPGVAAAICASLGLLLTGRLWPSLMSALTATFFLQVWNALPVYPSPSFAGLLSWPADLKAAFVISLRATTNLYEPDQFAMYRFGVPAISYALLAGFVYALTTLDARRRPFSIAAGIVLCMLLAFSYPPICIIAFAILAVHAVAALIAQDRRAFNTLLLIGAIPALTLAAAGVPHLLFRGFEGDTFISAIYGSQSFEFQKVSAWTAVERLILNKYIITFLFMLTATRRNSLFRHVLATTGIALLIFTTLVLLEPGIYARFLERGIDHLWLCLLSLTFFNLLAGAINRANPAIGMLARASTALILMLGASLGFLSLYETNRVDNRSFIPIGRFEAYQWLTKHASGETIAALNWDDIEFIAIYDGNLKCVFGPADLSNARPEVVVRRYVSTWKELGLRREQMKQWASRSVETEYARLLMFRDRKPTPFLSPDDFAASRIVSALVYYPYISHFQGGQVGSSDAQGWHTDPAFIDNMLRMFDQAPADGFLAGAGVKYVLLSPVEMRLLDKDRLLEYETAFSTPERTVLERKSKATQARSMDDK